MSDPGRIAHGPGTPPKARPPYHHHYTASQDAASQDARKEVLMMNFAEIEKLLDGGFTPEQIMQLQQQPASKDAASQDAGNAADQKQDAADQKQDAPDWAQALTESISGLRKTIQAQALAAAQQSAPKSVDDMAQDALAAIIAPTYNKNNEGGK